MSKGRTFIRDAAAYGLAFLVTGLVALMCVMILLQWWPL